MRGYWPQTLRASADICSTEGLGPGMSTDVEMVVVLRLQLHIPSGLQDVQQLNGHDVDALPPQRGGGEGGCLVAIEAATPNGGTTTNQNPQFPTFPLPLICRLDISRCKCFHNQECVVCDDSCDADKPVNDFNPLAAVPDCQVE